MIERVTTRAEEGAPLASARMRYGVLDRLSRLGRRWDVRMLAFGFEARGVRLVLEGAHDATGALLKGLKLGTSGQARSLGLGIAWERDRRRPVEDLTAAVCWAHRGPLEAGAAAPLASPWSSHRDLLGFRSAEFYDAGVLAARVSGRRVHARLDGGRLPGGPVPARRESLDLILRVSAGVRGVLPADRRCFRLFSHLACDRGWGTIDAARALVLTPRRIRQLRGEPEPLLPMAARALGDPRLRCVP